jgi:hypothetical protein
MQEYNHHQAGSPEKSFKNANTRSVSELFEKVITYIEDEYERKEDMRRLDY